MCDSTSTILSRLDNYFTAVKIQIDLAENVYDTFQALGLAKVSRQLFF